MEERRGDPSHQEEEENSEDSDNPADGTWFYKEEPVAQNSKIWVQPLAHGASSSVDKESQKNTEATSNHYLQISPHASHCMEAVFSMVKKFYGRQLGDSMKDWNVNLAIWGTFMSIILRAAVHLEKDYDTNFEVCKESSLENNRTAS